MSRELRTCASPRSAPRTLHLSLDISDWSRTYTSVSAARPDSALRPSGLHRASVGRPRRPGLAGLMTPPPPRCGRPLPIRALPLPHRRSMPHYQSTNLIISRRTAPPRQRLLLPTAALPRPDNGSSSADKTTDLPPPDNRSSSWQPLFFLPTALSSTNSRFSTSLFSPDSSPYSLPEAPLPTKTSSSSLPTTPPSSCTSR